jgi:hypothetical protein
MAGTALIAPSASAQQPPSVTSLVNGLGARYGAATSMSATFDERRWNKAQNQEQAAAGHVAVTRGAVPVWTYRPPLVSTPPPPDALCFFGGLRGYSLTVIVGHQVGFSGGDILVATPQQPSPAVSKVLLYVGPAYEVRRVMVIDGQGNRYRIDFRDERLG